MTRPASRSIVLVLPLLVVPGAAQERSPAPAPAAFDFSVPIHEGTAAHAPGHGTWAARGSYKVSFHDGVAVYPLLGESYPHNLPLRWRTEAVAAGNTLMPLAAQPPARHDDWRFELQHPGVREVYEVRAEGLEQMFVLEQRTSGGGDLVVRGRIETELRADPAPRGHQALTFRDEGGRPILRYGEATAIDANGCRIAADTAFDGRTITLTVDGAWLAQAALPVVLDPLMAPVVLAATSNASWAVGSTDVANDPATYAGRNVMVGFTRIFSAADHDVFAFYCSADFSVRTQVLTDIASEVSDRNVTIAYVPGAQRWMIGYEREYDASATLRLSTIRVYFHDRFDTTGNSGSAWSIPQLFPRYFRNPDLGGPDHYSASPIGILTYVDEANSNGDNYSRVVGVRMNAATTQFLNAWEVGNAPSGTTYDREHPTVNQVAFNDEGWVIAYQELDRLLANDDWDIRATRTDGNANELSSNTLVSGVNNHVVTPQVAGHLGSYMLTFGRSADLTTAAPATLEAMPFQWPALGVPATGAIRVVTGGGGLLTSLANHALAADTVTRSNFAMTYTRRSLVGLYFATSAHVARLGGTAGVTETATLFSATDASAVSPSITFVRQQEEFAVAYGTNETVGALFHPVYARTFAYPATAGEFRYGTVCGPAVIDGNRPYLGNLNYGVGFSSGPANGAAILLLALGSGSVPLDGIGMTGCALNVDPAQILLTVATTVSAAGNASVALPLPDAPAGPFDVWFQYVYTSFGANPANLQATHGLRSQVR